MTDVISLTRELYEEVGTKARSIFNPHVTIPGIGISIGPKEEPVFDEYGPAPKEDKGEGKYKTLNEIYKDTAPLEQFYGFLRSKGIEVCERPQEYIARTFGYARDAQGKAVYPIGWRTGNTIYIARNDGKKYLADNEKMAVAGHEYEAGEGHYRTDIEAQKCAIKLFSPEGEFPDATAYRKAIELAPRVGLYNFSLN